MKELCPVCGYNELFSPPKNDMICPCCGTQFGYDDFQKTHEQLRENWLREGTPWHSRRTLPPVGWSAEIQLAQAGYTIRSLSAA